ncbi:hypothetical protein PYW07_008330 [Mythimna separata]|uniref:Uncharacterized protein n=1 Tax=Mythimna separata TaxID=271217 RepID=A0AAD7YCH7_MYTSE|nr:hypothetical protein PYW07_008327 [Mythimna separata]KAJ8711086.1 hypothetical protein PYW07_008328 [Mythimna separata]KAJ8711087.1 hypothetical protein PYW07_008329 [Mythimna separata]KAJ8711088.1 hypothetical protein PYW07_008330 [Mythimna separata]
MGGLHPARCIALASGTLTPLISLHSELATSFPHRVSPNHVIPQDRPALGTGHQLPAPRLAQPRHSTGPGEFYPSGRHSLMCMNPAIVMGGLHPARCIALASGTLTPLISLHSELATSFPHRVSPNHVIPQDRVSSIRQGDTL